MATEGYHRPGEPPMPDVTLTGDEFTHLLALEGEIISGGNPPAHYGPRVALGVRKPGCPICEAIQGKAEVFLADLENLGLA